MSSIKLEIDLSSKQEYYFLIEIMVLTDVWDFENSFFLSGVESVVHLILDIWPQFLITRDHNESLRKLFNQSSLLHLFSETP